VCVECGVYFCEFVSVCVCVSVPVCFVCCVNEQHTHLSFFVYLCVFVCVRVCVVLCSCVCGLCIVCL